MTTYLPSLAWAHGLKIIDLRDMLLRSSATCLVDAHALRREDSEINLLLLAQLVKLLAGSSPPVLFQYGGNAGPNDVVLALGTEAWWPREHQNAGFSPMAESRAGEAILSSVPPSSLL